MNMIDDWFWEELTKQPYLYLYNSLYDNPLLFKHIAKHKMIKKLREDMIKQREPFTLEVKPRDYKEFNFPDTAEKIIEEFMEKGDNMSETRYTRQKGVELNKDNLVAILGQLIQSDYVEKFKVNLFEEYITVTDGKGNTDRFDYYDYLEITKDTIRLAKENNLPEIFNELIDKDYVERVTVNKPNECISISTDDDIIGERYSFGDMLEFAMVKHGYKKVNYENEEEE